MARKKQPPQDYVKDEHYDLCCKNLEECDAIEAEVQRAIDAGIPDAENALRAVENARQRNIGIIHQYFPGRSVPGQPKG